jgi:hypothetical protein
VDKRERMGDKCIRCNKHFTTSSFGGGMSG